MKSSGDSTEVTNQVSFSSMATPVHAAHFMVNEILLNELITSMKLNDQNEL